MIFALSSRDDIEAIGRVLDYMDEETGKMDLPSKEKVRIQLTFEEAMTKLLEYADDNNSLTLEVTPRRFLGSVSFSLKIPGREFDFMNSIKRTVPLDESEMSPEIAESINNIFLDLFKDRLKYSYHNGYNYIRILAVRSPYTSLFRTVAAIILAVISGALLKGYASPELCSNLGKNIFAPIVSILMNGMKMCTIPLVFFSLVSCISRFGDLGDMKKLGLKCLSCFFSAQFISAFIAICVFFMFKPVFSSATGMFANIVAASSAASGQQNILMDMLKDLIPSSVLRPFVDNNVLQLLVLGFLVGSAIQIADAKSLRAIIEEFHTVLNKVMIMFLKFVPFIVFCSTINQMLSVGMDTLIQMSWLFSANMTGLIIAVLLYCLVVAVMRRGIFRKFLIAATNAMLTAASILSSKATIPSNMEACRKLDVHSEVYSMSVPMAAIFNQNGECIRNITVSLCLALFCGIDVSAMTLISLSVYAIILITGASGFVSFLATPIYLGVPMEVIELVLGITQILDIFVVALDSLGSVAMGVLMSVHTKAGIEA